MAATISDIDACTKRLEVAVPREEVAEEMERAFRRLAGRVRIKGFRRGKVPRRILERYYGEEVQAEVLNRVISSSYRRLLEERGMRPVGEPNVSDIEMDEGAPELTYKATVEVIPPFELGEYTGIEVRVRRQPVTDEAVEEQIERLRRRAATYEDVGRPARQGDYVLFDIEGFEEGAPVAGTGGENQALLLGEGGGEPELEQALVGMRAEEEKEIEIRVPENAAPALAGRTLQFRIRLKAVKEAHPPALDEDFVRSLGQGYATVEELRGHVVKEMEAVEDYSVRQQAVAELMRRLVEGHPFEVPPTLVRAEVERRIREIEQRLRAEDPEAFLPSGRREELREELRPLAEERVREIILVERIREREGIHPEPEEIEAQIRASAARYGMDPEKLKKRMILTGGMDSLVSNLNYNKTVAWLYDSAKIEVKIEDSGPEEGSPPEPAEAGESQQKG